MERALALGVERTRPPGRTGSRCQARKVLLDHDAQLDFVAGPALGERDRSAGAQREQTSPDRVPARNEVVGTRELGRTETEEARTAQQNKPTALRAPARANAAAREAADACQYANPSQRAPDSECSTRGSRASTRCLDSKAPDSSTRSFVSQPCNTSTTVSAPAWTWNNRRGEQRRAAARGGHVPPRGRLAEQQLLRPDVTAERAADVIWLLASFDAFDLLYTGRGLSPDDVAEILVTTAERTLLA